MSESAAAEPAAVTPTEASEQSESSAQEIDWKAKSRMWEQRAKQNNDAATRLAEIEEASKTEAQKLAERADTAEKTASEKDRALLKLTVIVDNEIPKDYQDLVHGETLEALQSSAAKVKALITANAAPQTEASFVIPSEGNSPSLALNSDGIESALRKALGIA